MRGSRHRLEDTLVSSIVRRSARGEYILIDTVNLRILKSIVTGLP
jgi:hypothetical protein